MYLPADIHAKHHPNVVQYGGIGESLDISHHLTLLSTQWEEGMLWILNFKNVIT